MWKVPKPWYANKNGVGCSFPLRSLDTAWITSHLCLYMAWQKLFAATAAVACTTPYNLCFQLFSKHSLQKPQAILLVWQSVIGGNQRLWKDIAAAVPEPWKAEWGSRGSLVMLTSGVVEWKKLLELCPAKTKSSNTEKGECCDGGTDVVWIAKVLKFAGEAADCPGALQEVFFPSLALGKGGHSCVI